MSLLEEALVARLLNVAGVTALVGARIYPALASQAAAVPYVVYQRIAGTRETAFGDDPGIQRARVQIACWSTSYTEARQVADQVRLALQRYRGTSAGVEVLDIFVAGDLDQYDEEALKHGAILDFQVITREA